MKYTVALLLTCVTFYMHASLASSELTGGGAAASRGTNPALDMSSWPKLETQCKSSCRSLVNNRNWFDMSLRSAASVTCKRRDFRTLCPDQNQKLVCSTKYKTKLCVDIDLAKDANGKPKGHFNLHTCKRHCESQGKRMLSNNEWLVASVGTDANTCLPPHSPGVKYNGGQPRSDRSLCLSYFGLKDMVGVLGQWVTGGHAARNRAQFNGGLWKHNHSTIYYRTTAHSPGYEDYSIGCRCASDI